MCTAVAVRLVELPLLPLAIVVASLGTLPELLALVQSSARLRRRVIDDVLRYVRVQFRHVAYVGPRQSQILLQAATRSLGATQALARELLAVSHTIEAVTSVPALELVRFAHCVRFLHCRRLPSLASGSTCLSNVCEVAFINCAALVDVSALSGVRRVAIVRCNRFVDASPLAGAQHVTVAFCGRFANVAPLESVHSVTINVLGRNGQHFELEQHDSDRPFVVEVRL